MSNRRSKHRDKSDIGQYVTKKVAKAMQQVHIYILFWLIILTPIIILKWYTCKSRYIAITDLYQNILAPGHFKCWFTAPVPWSAELLKQLCRKLNRCPNIKYRSMLIVKVPKWPGAEVSWCRYWYFCDSYVNLVWKNDSLVTEKFCKILYDIYKK